MNYKFGLLFFILSLLVSCNSEAENHRTTSEDESSPNIIYIIADDLGYGDLSVYGQETLKTPNIDALAAQGMRFSQHYAGSTVCAPSRASLLTSKQPGRSSVRGNQPPGQLIKDKEITIPEALKAKKYVSSMIGKWGVGHPPTPTDPLRNGFDEYFGYVNMWHAHNFFPEFLYKNAQKIALKGNVTDTSFDYSKYHKTGMPEGTGVAKEKETYVLGEFEREALEFIERNQNNPFFLYLALNMPHANNEAGLFLEDGMEVPMFKKEGEWVADYGEFTTKDWPNPEKGFARMMQLIDETVGKVVQQLEQLDIDNRTVIIFTSDNGPHQEGNHKVDYFNSNGDLRGAKRDLYEGGIRVPLIIKWPGKIKAGSTSKHPCAFWDILPTLCDIAGVNKPDDIDGISFYPTLVDQPNQVQHEYLYWEFYEQGGRQAVRQGKWKYVKLNVRDDSQAIVTELYNLEIDLGETTNVIDQYPEIAEKMEVYLKQSHQPIEKVSLFSLEIDS